MAAARCRIGDELVVTFSTRTLDDSESVPDSTPAVSCYQDGGRVDSREAVLVPGGDSGVYAARVRAGAEFAVGKLSVVIRWRSGGDDRRLHVEVEVLPGGDREGSVISLYAFNRPDGRYVVAQCSGGRVFRGKNPRLTR